VMSATAIPPVWKVRSVQLRARLPNGLRGNHTDSLAYLHISTSGQVTAVALGADAVLALAGNRRTKPDARDAKLLDGCGSLIGNHAVLRNQDDVLLHSHSHRSNSGTPNRRENLLAEDVPLVDDHPFPHPGKGRLRQVDVP